MSAPETAKLALTTSGEILDREDVSPTIPNGPLWMSGNGNSTPSFIAIQYR